MKAFRAAVLAATLIGLSSAASADVIGFSAGIGYWGQEPSGTVTPGKNSDQWDVKDDFNLDSDHAAFVWAALEHPIPVLPNIRLEYTPMSLTGDGHPSRTLTFEGTPYTAADNIHADFTLNQTDVILYYELLDNWVNLDVGVDGKYVDGETKVRSQTGARMDNVSFSGVLPLLYVNARFDIPATGIFLGYPGQRLGLFRQPNRRLAGQRGLQLRHIQHRGRLAGRAGQAQGRGQRGRRH